MPSPTRAAALARRPALRRRRPAGDRDQPRRAHRPRCSTAAADMTIATLPAQITAGGGRGLVVGLARRGIEHLTGFRAVQPLSGMRCVSPAAFDGGQPARARLGGRDRADRRRAAGRAHRARGALRAAAPGQRPRLARPGAPGRAVPRRLARARAARLAAVAPGLTRAHRLLRRCGARRCCSSSGCPPRTPPSPTSPRPAGCACPGCRSSWDRRRSRRCCGRHTSRWRWPCSSACGAGSAALRTWLAPGILAVLGPPGRAVRVGRPRQLPRLRPHPRHGRQPVGRRADHLGRRPRPRDQPGRGAVDHRAERLRPVRHAAARAVGAGSGGGSLRAGGVGVAAASSCCRGSPCGPCCGPCSTPTCTAGSTCSGPSTRSSSASGCSGRTSTSWPPPSPWPPSWWPPSGRGGRGRRSAGSSWPSRGRRSSRMPSSAVGSRRRLVARGSPLGGAGAAGRGARRRGSSSWAAALHLWAGPHVYDQLLRSRQAVSLATPWRPLLEWGRDAWRQRPDPRADQRWRRRCWPCCSPGASCASAAPPPHNFPARCGKPDLRTGTEPRRS